MLIFHYASYGSKDNHPVNILKIIAHAILWCQYSIFLFCVEIVSIFLMIKRDYNALYQSERCFQKNKNNINS